MYLSCKIWTRGVRRGVSEVSGNYSGPLVQQVYCSFIPSCTQHSVSAYMYIVQVCTFRMLRMAAEAYSWKAVIHFSTYATVNSTNALSSHWFSFVWLAYSFLEWVQIVQKIRSGENQFLGGQNKRDRALLRPEIQVLILESQPSEMVCKWTYM